MQPPYYNMPMQFMPSQSTLNAWLRTRKSNSQNKPGIFETVEFAGDTVWAICAILIELSAFFLTLFGAWQIYSKNQNMPMLITALIIVFLFIAFDIIGIMLHGQDNPEKVKLKSEMVITHDPAIKAYIIKKTKQIGWREFLGFMLLIVSGILKILAISVFFKSQSGMAAVIILILFYLVVIYIHAYHTGYWWAARNVQGKLKRDFDKFLEHQKNGTPNPFLVLGPQQVLFDSNVPMGVDVAHHGRQTIDLVSSHIAKDGASVFSYRLSSVGCIFDHEIVSMAAAYNPSFSTALIEACIKLQFQQLGVIALVPSIASSNVLNTLNSNQNNPIAMQNNTNADGKNNVGNINPNVVQDNTTIDGKNNGDENSNDNNNSVK
jgi:hypothetical protein